MANPVDLLTILPTEGTGRRGVAVGGHVAPNPRSVVVNNSTNWILRQDLN
jgi:hypothetical protein